jgi:tRNA 2-thiouridine synthesizing protein E
MQPDTGAKPVPTGDEGYLVDPSDWSEEVAVELARREGIVLTEEHWAVIRFVREYYEQHHIIPDARFVIKFLAETRGAERNDLFKLFPYGYVKQTCKIAGMRKPRAWSTG